MHLFSITSQAPTTPERKTWLSINLSIQARSHLNVINATIPLSIPVTSLVINDTIQENVRINVINAIILVINPVTSFVINENIQESAHTNAINVDTPV